MATQTERRPHAALLEAAALTPHHEALARLLWHAELRGEPVEPLSATFPELDVADAYRVQAIGRRLRTAGGEELRGWKVGLTSRAMQEMMGVEEPDGGYLFESMVVQSGASIRASRFIQPRVEAEIAFLLKSGLEGPCTTREDVLDATLAFAPALELIDSRICGWRIGIVDTVADNASSGMAAIGEWHDAERLRAERIEVDLTVGGEQVRGRGDAVLGHPAEAVAWLVRTLADQGERLEPGDIVLPGSVARALPIAAGQRAHARFDGLGEVRVGLVHD
ncbi:MAG: 2-oxopent-4-enoate hydratase [Conexibacter sp.]|jgi:2-keto-4-pentenoate hydratase|nr:2-oxopent-4-enoate hydratase [Conexibacter sp.]